ncbi:hypothetical protein JXQ70_06405 [bacterium]|nr:hypothetical protein [bacterium]
MTEGIEQPIGVTTIIELLKGGSKYEDEGKRASHHFHRPIPSDGSIGQKPWSDAGIMDPWLLDLITSDAPKYSAAVWATDYLGPDQPHESEPLTNNEYNWDRARE